MAFKRTGPSAVSKTTISSVSQIPQQKPKLLPPSPPSFITLKDLQDALAESSQQTVKQLRLEMEQLYDKKNEELCENIAHIFRAFAEHIDRVEGRVEELEAKTERMEKRLGSIEENVEIAQNDIVMAQYNEMEFALRIRGLKEDVQEKLKEKIATSLALVLGCDFETIFEEIEKAYRINSRVALQRNLPRDVVVYFSRRIRRNKIIQTFYQQRFQIAAQDIILLKEIPSKILQKRKDFAFLTQELKNRQIPFRWNIPIGIMVTFESKRYRLNTVQKAKEFYLSILKVDLSSSPRLEGVRDLSRQQGVELSENILLFQEDLQNLQLSEAREDVGEQRMTRAAYRRKAARDKERKGT